jgi:hypothetical protein
MMPVDRAADRKALWKVVGWIVAAGVLVLLAVIAAALD